MTTNGQAPFVTVFMYLNEVPEGRLREDLAMITEEILRQRILGVKMRKVFILLLHFQNLYMYLKKIIYARAQNIGI